MTSTIVQPNTYGLDAASFHAVTNFAPVRDAGAQWVSFYIGGTYGVSARNLEGAWAAGLPVMPNFERTANAGLGGYTTGQLHATTATTQLTALGFLGECPVIFSGVDFGPTAGQFPAIDNYHRAIVDTLAPHGWTGGAYGPRSYLQHLAAQDFWPDWPLWHWGGDGFAVHDWAWCKQWYGYDQTPIRSQTLGYAVDENTLFKPMKFWAGYGADTDPPPEEIIAPVPIPGDTMTVVVQCTDAFAAFEGEQSTQGIITFVRWIDGERKGLITGAPFNVPVVNRTVAELHGMTLVGPLPTGDQREWTGGEFYKHQTSGGGPAGPQGPQGPPGPAPTGATFTY